MKKQLEIGDKIAQIDRLGSSAVRILTVTRTTATQAICKVGETEWRFNREASGTFCEKGSTGWGTTYYRIATETDFLHIEHTKLRSRLKKTDWENLPIEKCEAILKIVKQ